MNLGFEDAGFGCIAAHFVVCDDFVVGDAFADSAAGSIGAAERVFFGAVFGACAVIADGGAFVSEAFHGCGADDVVFDIAEFIFGGDLFANAIYTIEVFGAESIAVVACGAAFEFCGVFLAESVEAEIILFGIAVAPCVCVVAGIAFVERERA